MTKLTLGNEVISIGKSAFEKCAGNHCLLQNNRSHLERDNVQVKW